MWLHKSRSVSKREKRCNILFSTFGYARYFTTIDVYLPNEKTNININELFENKGIDCDNAFNYKLSGLDINIFKLPLIESEDNNTISIGIKDNNIIEDILCIKKDDSLKLYLLLPYFKVNKDNLEEGKYVNKHTQKSYHLGLFEIQIQDEILTSAILIETISIKDKITLNEFFNDISDLKFYQKAYKYSVVGLSGQTYFLTHKLTNSVYFLNFSDITNPKIGNIYCNKYNVKQIGNESWKVSYFSYNKGRWFSQFKVGHNDYFIKDNYNGKYEKIEILKKEKFDLNKHILLYNQQKNPYSPYTYDYLHGELEKDKDVNIYSLKDSDLHKLPFAKSINRYIRFQITPFNNLNLVYFDKYNDGKYLYEYSIIPENKGFKRIYKKIYILNSKTIISKYKYKINREYKNTYHCYLYYLDNENKLPYIQVWKDKDANKIYGCILNMRGKWGLFDKEIIKEK